MLFQVDLTNPTPISSDSLSRAATLFLEKAQSDPRTFWDDILHSAIHFGLKVLLALVIYFVGAWLIRYVKRFLGKIFDRRHTEKTLASFITSFVSIVLTVLLFIATIGTLGIDTTSFAALLTAGGMAIGMALSGTVQNFAGGVMLLIFRPFKAGDFIKASGESGTVMEVTIVSTKILTPDHRIIMLPNGSLFGGNIENVSAQPLRRVDWTISVEYGVDAAKCKQAILDIVQSDVRVLRSSDARPASSLSPIAVHVDGEIPEPFVALSSLNSNDISFVVRAWVKAEDYWGVYFDLNERFYTELPPQGFGFAYPHMDVTVLSQK